MSWIPLEQTEAASDSSNFCAICCYRSRGFDYNCFGKPQLLTDSDLSLVDAVENAEGTVFEDNLKSRLMLIVEDANLRENHAMEEMAEQKLNDNILSASPSSIPLCSLQHLKMQNCQPPCNFSFPTNTDTKGILPNGERIFLFHQEYGQNDFSNRRIKKAANLLERLTAL